MAKRRTASKEPESAAPQRGGLGEQVLADYLGELKAIHASGAGVAETSFYAPLAVLFNAVGKTLKPKVRCILQLRDRGAGLPDGGLFTADQYRRQTDTGPTAGQLPARGAIEVKGTRAEVAATAASEQVQEYLKTYGIVLVTNLRQFLIVERGPSGQPIAREAFSLAESEHDFWHRQAANPRATARQQGAAFLEFVRRACLHAAPLTTPRDVAWFLASYARDALARVERQKHLPALEAVRSALEDALGMEFTGGDGEHFFRSTLVQTLFYGVFSAWVRWHKDHPGRTDRFDWRTAEWSLHVPFIRTLYEEVAKPSRLGPLGLVEVLDWSAGVLNRVDRGEFFGRFEDEHAVQYFYEPFLEAYDPALRKAMGVWYTPAEIVKYQVARVDHVLREELNLADGLADPNVVVLDPCCGTGAYLVEVLHRIAATLREKGGDALVAADLKHAAMHRVFGFEIMPAPFVVSHLQLGLLLQAAGAPLSPQAHERVGVYLTNALTGWEPPRGPKRQRMLWPELQEERERAEHVKRVEKILVVLGNPPYNAFAGVSPEEEHGLVEPYKKDLNKAVDAGGWGIKKFNLDDLYVRFFRLAERRIAEMSGRGVVSFISNFSYLSDPSFVVLRQRFLSEFDKLWLDCLNGDSRETGKLTPDGEPDPSVFSTEYNREGIRVGTAVCVMVRRAARQKKPTIRFRQFWGVGKRPELLASLNRRNFNAAYTLAHPQLENRLSFRPEEVADHYADWPKLAELCELAPLQGMDEDRANALIDIEQETLATRVQAYLDPALNWEPFAAVGRGLARDSAGFDARKVRDAARRSSKFNPGSIRRYLFRPLDTRYCYYTEASNVWKRHRPELIRQAWTGNSFLLTRPTGVAAPEGVPFLLCRNLLARDSMRGHAIAFPLQLRFPHDRIENGLFERSTPHANLSGHCRAYLRRLGIADADADAKTAALVWLHALAIGYSPDYLTENADGIRRDWPRIPLPATRRMLEVSAALGEQVAALLDTETDVPGVTAGRIAPACKAVGLITKCDGGAIDPADGDLTLTAGWGHAGKDGVTMPAKGRIEERPYKAEEKEAIATEAASRNVSAKSLFHLLGAATCDVYLNDAAFWRNVPRNVWEYRIGGYQVLKKWLSYREAELLGRSVTPEEAREVTNIARRLTALLLLQPRLDENYQRVQANAFPWPTLAEE